MDKTSKDKTSIELKYTFDKHTKERSGSPWRRLVAERINEKYVYDDNVISTWEQFFPPTRAMWFHVAYTDAMLPQKVWKDQ